MWIAEWFYADAKRATQEHSRTTSLVDLPLFDARASDP